MRAEFHTKLMFKIIVSIEDQYSLWLIDREVPPGWRDAGQMQGSAVECLAFIKEYSRKRFADTAPESRSHRTDKFESTAAWA